MMGPLQSQSTCMTNYVIKLLSGAQRGMGPSRFLKIRKKKNWGLTENIQLGIILCTV